MACKANLFVGSNEQNKRWKNWSGGVSFAAAEYFEPAHTSPVGPPDGLLQLVHVIARATSEHTHLKAVGSSWAFEDLAAAQWVVSLRQLTRRLDYVIGATGAALTDDWRTKQLDVQASTRLVHVEAGIELGALSEMLQTEGLALPVLGGHNGQSLAGAISTSTHGGDWEQPPLPDLVRAIHLVTDGGRELWIERASAPITTDARLGAVLTCADTRIVRSDIIFNSALVSFGRFGVMYSLVIEVRKEFRVVEITTTPTRPEVLQALRNGQNGGRLFGPLFTLLSNTPAPPGLSEAADPAFFQSDPYFLQVLFSSQDPDDCWVTRRWETTDPADLPPGSIVRSELSGAGVFLLANLAFGAAAGLALLIPGKGVVYHARLIAAAAEMAVLAAVGKPTQGAALASALTAAWQLPFVGNAIPQIAAGVLNGHFKESIDNGRRGAHHLITSGTRDESRTFTVLSESIEVIFDAATSSYLDFLDVILSKEASFKQSGYVSLRPSRSSRATLSMHNVAGSYAMSIEVSTAQGLPDNMTWMAFVHQTALQHGGRPHWGQYNKLTEAETLSLYHDRLTQWRETLHRVSKDSTVFSNHFTQQRGLEPLEGTEPPEPPPSDLSYLVPLLLDAR